MLSEKEVEVSEFTKQIRKGLDIIVLKLVEIMATSRKILKTLRSAKTYTDRSILAIGKKDRNLLENNVWHIAAELEYALFLFSVKIENEVDKSKWRPNPRIKKVEVAPFLAKVQTLLNESDKSLKGEKLLDAFKSSYIARDYVLAIQKDFTKKRREALRKKK